MPNLSEHPVALTGAFYRSTAAAEHPLGSKGVSTDGRIYRYVRCGSGSALIAGKVIQSPAIIPNHLANTSPVVAAGATSFTYTPGNTAAAADFYAGGYLQVDTNAAAGTACGYTYGIKGHAAITGSTAFTLNLREDDPIQIALDATATLGLIANPYRGVIQLPVTTATGTIVGVASYIIGVNEHGWIQTGGVASVLTTGTPALGALVMGPGTVAGAVQVVAAAGTLLVAQIIGHMAQVGVDGKYNFVKLKIDE